jgi:hypothetical protein
MNSCIPMSPKKGAARCPRFDSCNAPVCPLDDWGRAQHLSGERVCGLLCELVKEGGEARLRARVPSDLVDTLVEVCPKVCARWERIRRGLDVASRSGSKLESGTRLNGRETMRAASNHPAPATHAPGEPCKPVTCACVGPSTGCMEASP